MVHQPITSPLRKVSSTLHHPVPMNWRERGVGIARIIFGLVFGVAAILKWQPGFQQTFVAQVTAAQQGQPASIQSWILFWGNLIGTHPLLFARVEASMESAIAIFLLLGVFTNLTCVAGIILSLGIWTIPEGFGGPYIPGQSTDIGTAFPYAILFLLLLCLAAGRYYGLDTWLTPRLGRLNVLASGSLRWRRK